MTTRKKPFLCKIGLHQIFRDTVGTNIGSEKTPIYMMNTYETCDRANCGWTTRPSK